MQSLGQGSNLLDPQIGPAEAKYNQFCCFFCTLFLRHSNWCYFLGRECPVAPEAMLHYGKGSKDTCLA